MDFEKKTKNKSDWINEMMHHSYLCDSTKKLMSAKPGSQVLVENVFGQPVCRVF